MRQSRMPAALVRGFTLVEILVGLVLGLITVIIMYQVFATFEGQRRTSVGSGDAQASGHLSMYLMEREVRLAGLGLMFLFRDVDKYDGQLACPGGVATYSAKAGSVAKASGIPAVPVQVTDGGAGSDSFIVTYGPSAAAGAPNLLLNGVDAASLGGGIRVGAAPFYDTATNKNAVFNVGDIIMVAQPGLKKHCVRLKLTSVTPVGDPLRPDTLLKADPPAEENPPGGTAGFMPTGGYTVDPGTPSFVMHLGSSLAVTEYKINANNQLTVGSPGAAGTPIAEGVVALQVRYGVGPKTPPFGGPELGCNTAVDAACQRIKAWTDAVNYDTVDWSKLNTVPANMDQRLHDIMRIKAARIAVVARSQSLERDVLYGAGLAIEPKATCTAGGDVVGAAGALRVCAWADGTNPDGTASPAPRVDLTGMADWDRYRYKVYETVVPLRNVMWGSKGS